jgi:hypothetical protein
MIPSLDPRKIFNRSQSGGPADPLLPRQPKFSRTPTALQADASPKDGYTIRRNNIHPAMHAMLNKPHFRSKDLALATSAIDRILRDHGIAHRFGGSMAAALYGGKRNPSDVDVEVGTDQDAQSALKILSHLNDDIKVGDNKVHVKSKFVHDHNSAGGQVRLKFEHPSGRVVEVDVDVINENHPNMIGGLHSPQTRGVAIDPREPNFLKPYDLIANYLDRLVSNPAYAHSKQDPLQVMSILHGLGFDPHDAEHVESLLGAIKARAKTDLGDPYVNEMIKIIDLMKLKHFEDRHKT